MEPKPRLAGARLFERRDQVYARRLECWRQTEQHPRAHRKRDGDGQHVPVQFRPQGEVLASIREQQSQETDSPDGERNAEHAAQRRQQNALSEELADDPKPSRP